MMMLPRFCSQPCLFILHDLPKPLTFVWELQIFISSPDLFFELQTSISDCFLATLSVTQAHQT